jgi:hypothetical protein
MLLREQYTKERYVTQEQYLVSRGYLLEEARSEFPHIDLMFEVMDLVCAKLDHLEGKNQVAEYFAIESATPAKQLNTLEEVKEFWEKSDKIISDILLPLMKVLGVHPSSKRAAAVQVIHARTIEIRLQIERLELTEGI